MAKKLDRNAIIEECAKTIEKVGVDIPTNAPLSRRLGKSCSGCRALGAQAVRALKS